MFFLILFSLFPSYPSEIIFNVLEKNVEIKIFAEDEKFRIEILGKSGEIYYKEKDKIMILQDSKWKEIKSPLYNENNYFLSLFLGKNGNLQSEIEKDENGLKEAVISSKEWGKVKLKRIKFNRLEEIPEGIFPKKSKLNLSKFKSLLTGEDEKEVSATAGARGVGEEENIEAEPNYNALKEVEKITVSKEEVEEFAKEVKSK